MSTSLKRQFVFLFVKKLREQYKMMQPHVSLPPIPSRVEQSIFAILLAFVPKSVSFFRASNCNVTPMSLPQGLSSEHILSHQIFQNCTISWNVTATYFFHMLTCSLLDVWRNFDRHCGDKRPLILFFKTQLTKQILSSGTFSFQKIYTCEGQL